MLLQLVLDVGFRFEVCNTGRIDLALRPILSSVCLPGYSLSLNLGNFLSIFHASSFLGLLLLLL